MTTKSLTFADFNLTNRRRADIYNIGADAKRRGVIHEIAALFGHRLTLEPEVANLGFLIEAVGPATDMQQNIAYVRNVVGPRAGSIALLHAWGRRSGLFNHINRSFMRPELKLPRDISTAVMLGGSRFAMDQCLNTLQDLHLQGHRIGFVLLGGSCRELTVQEDFDNTLHALKNHRTEANYLQKVVMPIVSDRLRVPTMAFGMDTSVGELIAERAAYEINLEMYSRRTVPEGGVLSISSAGAWMQHAGQLRRAFRHLYPERDFDVNGEQLYTWSTESIFGAYGDELPDMHINPYTIPARIARAAQETTRNLLE